MDDSGDSGDGGNDAENSNDAAGTNRTVAVEDSKTQVDGSNGTQEGDLKNENATKSNAAHVENTQNTKLNEKEYIKVRDDPATAAA